MEDPWELELEEKLLRNQKSLYMGHKGKESRTRKRDVQKSVLSRWMLGTLSPTFLSVSEDKCVLLGRKVADR